VGLVAWGQAAQAAPNLRSLVPFAKRVEADAEKTYLLTEEHGPWMVLATSFAGAGAEEQARELVFELRKNFNLEAYQHRRTFDFTEPVIGNGLTPEGEPRKMRHRQSVRFDEIAVLVGNYSSPDSSDIEAASVQGQVCAPQLSRPEKASGIVSTICRLARDPAPHQSESRQAAARADGQRLCDPQPTSPGGILCHTRTRSFVVDMNRGVEHSLLDCPGKYTVKVATFRGETTMDLTKMDATPKLFRNQPSKLEIAADKAHRLTKALRKKGIEAYEFHDRYESIVTVGSFQTVGTPREDGKIEINPAVHRSHRDVPGRETESRGHGRAKPRMLDDIPFDVQPQPVEVPREEASPFYPAALGADRQRENGRLR
jgi:hypothetical protein